MADSERHLHLSAIQAAWLYVLLFLVVHPLVKYMLSRYRVPGVSDIALNT